MIFNNAKDGRHEQHPGSFILERSGFDVCSVPLVDVTQTPCAPGKPLLAQFETSNA